MKWTISSLYLLVFISLLGFGWAIDRVYDSYQDDTVDPLDSHKIVFSSFLRKLDNETQPGGENTNSLPDIFQLDAQKNFPLPAELAQQLENGELIILESEQGLSLHQKLNKLPFILGYGPVPNLHSQANTLEFSLTIIFYLGIALVLIIWITPLVRSVQTLSSAARQVGDGNLNTRLNPDALYLADLNRDFNSMVVRLNTLSDNNQLFSQAVSHDLRTPLARIKFALEKLGTNNRPDQPEIIEKIQNDIQQIEILTSELLDYARLEQTRALQNDRVDLYVFLQQSIGEFSHRSDDISFEIDESMDWHYQLDSSLFHKVMHNLIQNAITYADAKIAISVQQSDSEIRILVEDDGKGIEASMLPEIFKPFKQANRQSKHHFGLGLAICRRAVDLLGGSIEADNQSRIGGARFIVRLPV